MGSAGSKHNSQIRLKTWAIAGYMSLDRDQCIELRNYCLRHMNPDSPHLSRALLKECLEAEDIKEKPDREILWDLYTMWDVNGDETVPLMPFFVGMSPLACRKHESFRSVLRFVLKVSDLKGRKTIDGEDLFVVLKSLNCTVAYLGDKFLKSKRLSQIVDDTLNTMSLMEHDGHSGNTLLHEDVATIITKTPLIKRLLLQQPDDDESEADQQKSKDDSMKRKRKKKKLTTTLPSKTPTTTDTVASARSSTASHSSFTRDEGVGSHQDEDVGSTATVTKRCEETASCATCSVVSASTGEVTRVSTAGYYKLLKPTFRRHWPLVSWSTSSSHKKQHHQRKR